MAESCLSTRMKASQAARGYAVFFLASGLLWIPTLMVAIDSAARHDEDMSGVYLMNACNTSTGESVLILGLVQCLVAGCLFKRFVCPMVFGDRWYSFDSLKQRKIVAYFVKTNVRVSMLVLILVWIIHSFSYAEGLFADANMKAAWVKMSSTVAPDSCRAEPLRTVHALRAWSLLRNSFLALMLWEICYIPEMGFEMWVHHGVIVSFTVLSLDPVLWAHLPQFQPILDGFTFFGMFGGGLLAIQEVCVLKYHMEAPDARRQAWWMQMAWILQAFISFFTFFLCPMILLVMQRKVLGFAYSMVFISGALSLSGAEVHMVVIKRAVVRHARTKLQPEISRNMMEDNSA